MVGPSCGSCGSPDVRKLSAIVGEGTWTSTSTTNGVGLAVGSHGGGALGVGTASTSHSGSTALARRLAPPARPAPPFPLALAGAAISGLLAGIFYLSGGMMWKSVGWPLFVAFVVLAPLAAWRWTVLQKKQKENEAVWQDQTARWQLLWYCAKCDSVSDATGGSSVSARDLQRQLAVRGSQPRSSVPSAKSVGLAAHRDVMNLRAPTTCNLALPFGKASRSATPPISSSR